MKPQNSCAGESESRPYINSGKGEKCQLCRLSGPLSKIQPAKVRRDSQGSLPKSAICAYLDDNATEL
jgi:hypothetical protein